MPGVQPKYNPATKKFEFPKPTEGKKRAAPVRGDISMISIPNSVYDTLLGYAKADGGDYKKDGVDAPHSWKARQLVKLYAIQAINEFAANRSKKLANQRVNQEGRRQKPPLSYPLLLLD